MYVWIWSLCLNWLLVCRFGWCHPPIIFCTECILIMYTWFVRCLFDTAYSFVNYALNMWNQPKVTHATTNNDKKGREKEKERDAMSSKPNSYWNMMNLTMHKYLKMDFNYSLSFKDMLREWKKQYKQTYDRLVHMIVNTAFDRY